MTEVSTNLRGEASDQPPSPRSAGSLHIRLIGLYVAGSGVAVVVTFSLVLIGLEFTTYQWVVLLLATAFIVPLYVIPDIYVIGRHYRPIGSVLTAR